MLNNYSEEGMVEMQPYVAKAIRDLTEPYKEMSLLELLAEENMMANIKYNRNLDPLDKAILGILRALTDKKLR